MKLCSGYLFSFLLFAATASASDLSMPIVGPMPQKCFSCNIPAPANFQASEIGSTWVRLTWTQSNLSSNRVRTYRASDHFLLNTTIVPAPGAELVVTIPTNTECYSVINAICEDGSNSEDEGTTSSFTTVIADIIVSGYSSGSGTPICSINAAGQNPCAFGNDAIFPFRIVNTLNNSSRGFGVQRQEPLHYVFHLANSNNGQNYKFYCDENTDPNPTCSSAYQITIKYGLTTVAILQTTQQGASTNNLICTQLEPNYSIQRILVAAPQGDGGRSELSTDTSPLSMSCPNPLQEVLPLRFNRITTTPVELLLFAANGQCLMRQNLVEGQQEYEISIAALAPGFYFLRVETEGLTETMKVFKTE